MVETVVSMALIGLLVVFLFSVFPGARAALAASENRGHAAWLGWSLLDQARAAGYEAVAPKSGSTTLKGVRDGVAYTRDVSWKVEVETVVEGKKRVWVTLSWSEPSGSKSVVLETLMAEDG